MPRQTGHGVGAAPDSYTRLSTNSGLLSQAHGHGVICWRSQKICQARRIFAKTSVDFGLWRWGRGGGADAFKTAHQRCVQPRRGGPCCGLRWHADVAVVRMEAPLSGRRARQRTRDTRQAGPAAWAAAEGRRSRVGIHCGSDIGVWWNQLGRRRSHA